MQRRCDMGGFSLIRSWKKQRGSRRFGRGRNRRIRQPPRRLQQQRRLQKGRGLSKEKFYMVNFDSDKKVMYLKKQGGLHCKVKHGLRHWSLLDFEENEVRWKGGKPKPWNV